MFVRWLFVMTAADSNCQSFPEFQEIANSPESRSGSAAQLKVDRWAIAELTRFQAKVAIREGNLH